MYLKYIYVEKLGHPKKAIDRFIEFVDTRYKQHQRAFLPHHLMFRCWDLQAKVEKQDQQMVYGFVGPGGHGKTTLAKNINYFHDPTFNQTRIASTVKEFAKIVKQTITEDKDNGKFKAILIDEPSNAIHSLSAYWRDMQDLLGQIRQLNLFICICATNLEHIKKGFYNLISGMFAFRQIYRFDYYDEHRNFGSVGILRKLYMKGGYECLNDFRLLKLASFKNLKSQKKTPIDHEDKIYRKRKKQELIKTLDNIINDKKDSQSNGRFTPSDIDQLIIKWRQEGVTLKKIGDRLGKKTSAVFERKKKLELHGIIVKKGLLIKPRDVNISEDLGFVEEE